MIWRFAAWTGLSALVHLLFLILPFAIMTVPVHRHVQEEVVPVKMVASLHAPGTEAGQTQPADDQRHAQQGQEPETRASSPDQEEGARFETEGKVSADYMTLLKARILYVWKYPDDAIQEGQQGKVGIAFSLNSRGELVEMGVVRSSGFPGLDAAVMDAIRKASPFGKIPDNAGSDSPLKITGHFVYVLD
jgi:TonB family protein